MTVVVVMRDRTTKPERIEDVVRVDHGVRFLTIYQRAGEGKVTKWRIPYGAIMFWQEHE